ncbi:uncharacterized protein LOC130293213 [Hyla sarda]|uniref:uncharacterized protein LOC130293213 n=1 Tax=Hyla sarda TaxID=327740 RepID=UPI0024C292B0|nr:uncharacterized protein LOC130293213 [Hyla sarda]
MFLRAPSADRAHRNILLIKLFMPDTEVLQKQSGGLAGRQCTASTHRDAGFCSCVPLSIQGCYLPQPMNTFHNDTDVIFPFQRSILLKTICIMIGIVLAFTIANHQLGPRNCLLSQSITAGGHCYGKSLLKTGISYVTRGDQELGNKSDKSPSELEQWRLGQVVLLLLADYSMMGVVVPVLIDRSLKPISILLYTILQFSEGVESTT